MSTQSFGLRVNCDDLYPYAKRGSVLLVDPDTDCTIGECVVLTLTTGQTLVRELVDHTVDSITVTDINRRSRQTFGVAEVGTMHPIGAVMAAAAWRSAEGSAA